MKKRPLLLLFTCCLCAVQAQLRTPWAAAAGPQNALPAYPRPQLVRKDWENLNGLWDYAITAKDAAEPARFDGKILVPYPIESALSGVQQALTPDDRLWYKRPFTLKTQKGKRYLLHFGAVDQQCRVLVNGRPAGEHSGGYDEFTFDITPLVKTGPNELTVSVYDPTDKGDAPYGKQTLNPRSIRYTAVSGIWQTVWLEAVPEVYIQSLYMTPDVDKGLLHISVNADAPAGYSVQLSSGYLQMTGPLNTDLRFPLAHPHLWSPEDPYLYPLSVKLLYKGKVIDTAGSYFGMRKIAVQKDAKGTERIFLNNKPYYNLGVLDQGYFPDGLYTAPTDEALAFDIKAVKSMGFNTIRKHIKIEPARWYYHCDRLGMLVWQDMPSWREPRVIPDAEKQNFEAESARHLQQLHNYPCIGVWVLFNEEWGSYDQERLAKWMKQQDPSRVLNAHSGSFHDDWRGSELTDTHKYPDPVLPEYESGKAMVCGEFGGLLDTVAGHEWKAGKGIGHARPDSQTFLDRYRQMAAHIRLMQQEGLSGTIFTEPYDVEIEENGIYTYDRRVFKIPADTIRAINQTLTQLPL